MSAPTPGPPREATLIRVARLARGLSPEAAADLTPVRLGGGRWRHIEQGYSRKTPFKAAVAPAKTLAHMAHTVGVTPDQLAEAGRSDAAQILAEILRQEAEAQQRETATDPRARKAMAILDELPAHIRDEVLKRYGGRLPSPPATSDTSSEGERKAG